MWRAEQLCYKTAARPPNRISADRISADSRLTLGRGLVGLIGAAHTLRDARGHRDIQDDFRIYVGHRDFRCLPPLYAHIRSAT